MDRKPTRPYREALLHSLADPVEATHYLNAALGDSPRMFLKALRNVAQARQMASIAKRAGVARESLYRALSAEGNPTLDTLTSVLDVLGFDMQVAVKEGGILPASKADPRTLGGRKRTCEHNPVKKEQKLSGLYTLRNGDAVFSSGKTGALTGTQLVNDAQLMQTTIIVNVQQSATGTTVKGQFINVDEAQTGIPASPLAPITCLIAAQDDGNANVRGLGL
jgi:probable addiction module antidote protein